MPAGRYAYTTSKVQNNLFYYLLRIPIGKCKFFFFSSFWASVADYILNPYRRSVASSGMWVNDDD